MTESERALLLIVAGFVSGLASGGSPDLEAAIDDLIATVRREAVEAERGMGR